MKLGKDGTSKQTDIALMNLLEITPNELYKNFITNKNLKLKMELEEKINSLSFEQIEAVSDIIEIIKKIK